MSYLLIPFFLVAQVNVNETVLRDLGTYGPEYAYLVSMTFATTPERNGTPSFSMNATADMTCRPKTSDQLACRLSNVSSMSCGILHDQAKFQMFSVEDQSFEVKFNVHGVESLRVPLPAEDSRLNAIKFIATQLSVGRDLTNLRNPTNAFKARENVTIGECETMFNVALYSTYFGNRTEDESDMDLTVLSQPRMTEWDNLLIEKTRDPMKCRRGHKYVYNLTDDEMEMNVTSSYSRISIVRRQSFQSYTVTEYKTLELNSLQASTTRIFVGVRLVGVTPAREPLSTASLSDAENVSVYVDENVFGNFTV